MPQSTEKKLRPGQILFLVIGVPVFFLLFLEVLARALHLPERLKKKQGALQLEMPTWMLRDDNARARLNPAALSAADADWWQLFEEGDGFRVRMKPHISAEVSNTFSLIPEDRSMKYLIKTNALGFRGEDLLNPKPPGTFRILLFGDSSTFGWGVQQGENYPEVLREELQKKFPHLHFETANFAMPGDSSEYGRLVFDAFMKKWEPDLVLLGFGANDAKKTRISHHTQVEKFRSRAGLQHTRQVLEWSALYRSLQQLLLRLAPPPAPAPDTKAVAAVRAKRYKKNLLEMARQSIESGSKGAAIVTLCTPGAYAQYAAAAAAAAPALFFNGQRYLENLLPEIRSKKYHPELVTEMERRYPEALAQNPLFYITSDGCHPNKIGHRLVGERLAELLASSHILQ